MYASCLSSQLSIRNFLSISLSIYPHQMSYDKAIICTFRCSNFFNSSSSPHKCMKKKWKNERAKKEADKAFHLMYVSYLHSFISHSPFFGSTAQMYIFYTLIPLFLFFLLCDHV